MSKSLIPWRRDRGEIQTRREDNSFEVLHREMNDLFANFFREYNSPFSGLAPAAGRGPVVMGAPSVDVSETDDEVQVTADLPGLTEKDVEVTLDDGALTIRGEKKEEREEKKRNYHLVERSYGRFERSVAVPHGIDPGKVKARFKNGVLNVTLPKTPESRSRSRMIEISAG
jgi:HSP20 family protein